MAVFANTFEGGTNGSTITTANSGGTSGDAFTATSTSGGTLTFDNTHAAHGSLGLKVTSSNFVYAERTYAAATSSAAIRLYCYFTALPTATYYLVGWLSGSTNRLRMSIGTTGQIVLRNAAGTALATISSAIPTNQWFRIEIQATLDATVGVAAVQRFDSMDSATVTDSATTASNINLGGTADRYRIGQLQGSVTTGSAYWLDDVAGNDTGVAIGPSGSTPASATGSLSLAGTVGAATPGTASGALALSGSSSAAAAGSVAGSLALTGSSSIAAGSAAAGALALTGTGGAAVTAAAAGQLSIAGNAAATAPGAANGVISLIASAASAAASSAIGSLILNGVAAARSIASAVGNLLLGGNATAAQPARDITLAVGPLSDSRITVGEISDSRITVGALSDSRLLVGQISD